MTPQEEVCWLVRRRAERLREKFYAAVFPPTLRGMCAICTVALLEAFRQRGWRGRAFYGRFIHNNVRPINNNHCWLEFEDKSYDLTATQFGIEYPEVYITDLPDHHYGDREWDVEIIGQYWKYAPQHERPSSQLVAMLLPEGE